MEYSFIYIYELTNVLHFLVCWFCNSPKATSENHVGDILMVIKEQEKKCLIKKKFPKARNSQTDKKATKIISNRDVSFEHEQNHIFFHLLS